MVDGQLVNSKRIELAAGASTIVEFTFNVTTEGKHSAKIDSLSAPFVIVPTGYHTLVVTRSGGGSKPMTFTLDGVTLNSPYTALLPVGKYTISAPEIVNLGTGVVGFDYWNDGSKSSTITVDLQGRLIVVATYYIISGYASCPSLFIWNGTDYVHVSEVSNAGWLGYMDYINEKGEIVYGGGNPWDFVKLDKNQLTPRGTGSDAYYDMILFQQWDELFYLDATYMMVVDHPVGTDVYTTMPNYVNQAFNGQIYSVSKNGLLTPISATKKR